MRGRPGARDRACVAAILSFTRAIAGTHVKQGIRATAICPGIVLAGRMRARFGDQAEGATLAEDHSFGIGESLAIAHVALFLASDGSCMVTGATISGEGGSSAY